VPAITAQLQMGIYPEALGASACGSQRLVLQGLLAWHE